MAPVKKARLRKSAKWRNFLPGEALAPNEPIGSETIFSFFSLFFPPD
jgi:hypothetical protein